MLTSFTWVPKGAMKMTPLTSNDTIEQVREKLMRQNPDMVEDGEVEEADMALAAPRNSKKKSKKQTVAEEAEDDDSDGDEDPNSMFNRFGGGVAEEIPSDDDGGEDKEDVLFKDTDLIFATTRADEEEPKLELFVYDDPIDALYVHHDANVSSYPLCSTWLSDGQLSMLAIGTMLPFIEIWPLDVMDAVEPAAVLGGCVKLSDNYRKRVKKSLLKPESHTDAILTLDWNVNAQHILASGGADDTIKIWDLNTQSCIGTYREPAKVQSLVFHYAEENLMLSGGFDKCAVVRDCRQPQQQALRWSLPEVVEHVEWAFHAPQFVASCSNGVVACFEARMNASAPVWSIEAHDAEATFGFSRHLPGLMATGGKNGYLNLYDVRSAAPIGIVSRQYNTGAVLGIQFHPNVPSVLGACGSRGEPLVYTLTEDLKKTSFTIPAVQ